MIQDTAPAAPGVKLKPRPRYGTTDRCCPSTPHVLRGGIQVIGSNFVLSIFEDCQLLGEAQFKKPMSGHKSSIEMPHGACKF